MEARIIRINRRAFLKTGAIGAAGLSGALRRPLAKTVLASDRYSRIVLAKGPVGYWRLGETAAPVAFDASGNGYDGAYVGNPSFAQLGAIANDPDMAIGLNGPDSRDDVEIPHPESGAFSQPTSGMGLTVEVWMRPDALTFQGQTADRYIHWLGKCVDGSGECEWGLRFYSLDSPSRPNRISAYIWSPHGGLGAGAFFQDDLIPGQWMHIVAVYEPSDRDTDPPASVHIYRDGVHRQGPPVPGTLYNRFDIMPAAGTLPVRLGTRDAAIPPAAVSTLQSTVTRAHVFNLELPRHTVLTENAGQAVFKHLHAGGQKLVGVVGFQRFEIVESPGSGASQAPL